MNIKRNKYKELIDHLDAKEISLIVGPRQVGKTTLMKELKKYLDNNTQNTLFLNLDIESDNKYFKSQESLIRKIQLEFGNQKGYVFIDEIQRKENSGLFLKGIYDRDLPYKFIVSGSGSLELKEKIHESLVGRKRIFELNPVSFLEFVHYKTNYKYRDNTSDFFEFEKEKREFLIQEYLNFGGYPKVITENELSEKNQIISEIYQSYLLNDIIYLLKVEKEESFSKMIRILASQIGQITNISNLTNTIGITVQTLTKYLWYAEKTFVLYHLNPFFRNKIKEITKSRIYYFFDIGLRNYSINLFGNISEEYGNGFLFQNFIANILREKIQNANYSLNFWRTKDRAEVDFIITRQNEIIPIEVKYKKLNKPIIKRSLRSFIEKYNPKTALVINLDYEDEIRIKDTVIEFVPFYHLFFKDI